MPGASRRHVARLVAAVAAGPLLSLLAACSDGDDSEPLAASTTSTALIDGGSAAPTSAPPARATTTVTAAPDSTGVAGVASEVPVCAGFARINGTFQLLAIAAAFAGAGDAALARLEVIAAPTLAAAVDETLAAWPVELDSERASAADDVMGPLRRRAERALQALEAAGVTPDQLAALRSTWDGVLITQPRDEPDISVGDLPAELDPVVTAAASELAGALTAFDEDPALRRGEATIPMTEQWLAQRCPEVLAGSGTDAV